MKLNNYLNVLLIYRADVDHVVCGALAGARCVCTVDHCALIGAGARDVMTHKYRGSKQSSREVKPKFIDSTQGEPKDIYKP
jgi:hypothetical protein